MRLACAFFSSRFQSSQRKDKDTVWTTIGGSRFANHHRKRSGRIVLELRGDLYQIGGGIIGLGWIELDFNGVPCAVRKLDDGVDFMVGIVLIMVQFSSKSFRIYLKIAKRKRLEEKAKRPYVAKQHLYCRAQQGGGNRRIAEVSFGLLFDSYR